MLSFCKKSGNKERMKILCLLPAGHAKRVVNLTVLVFALAQLAAGAITNYYVATNGPGGGFTNWATAASNIQDAINVTLAGDVVWVSNGVYNTGGRTNWPEWQNSVLTNRVAITKAITVRSFNNDPTNTIIVGAKDTVGGTPSNGPAAVRCVYMADGSSLIGFTLTNGATLASGNYDKYGGGVFALNTNSAIVSNCVIAGNISADNGGGVYYCTLYNCTLINNSNVSKYGGGAYAAIIYDSILSGNSVLPGGVGGGAFACRMYNCTLNCNSASQGGGAYSCTMTNCVIINNTASAYGGGCVGGNIMNCIFSNNYAGSRGGALDSCNKIRNSLITSNAAYYGGAVSYCYLTNCLISRNLAMQNGGAQFCILNNCTVVSNVATSSSAGGIYASTNWNCIIYFNKAPSSSNWMAPVSLPIAVPSPPIPPAGPTAISRMTRYLLIKTRATII
jgi:hypothetical protein